MTVALPSHHNDPLVMVPLLLPLVTAIVLLLAGRVGVWRRWFVLASATAQLGVALAMVATAYGMPPRVMAAGGWMAPFGIVLVIDMLTAIMLTLGAITALTSILFGYAEMPARRTHPLRLPLVQFLMLGINLTFCTGDLFNLFVGFEVMLISSYGLLTLEADDWDIRQTFPYLALNLFGSTLFLVAAGVAYAIFGSLNFAQIMAVGPEFAGEARVTVLGLLLLVVFGLKAGLFPLYYWLPNSYPILPTPVAALYAGMLTKVGIYVLLRIFGQVLPTDLTVVHTMLSWLAGITMLFGVIGAVSRNFIRGILSFHILSQIGYMALAVGFFTEYAFTAAIFYIIHHIVVKSSLFMVGGAVAVLNGTDNLEHTGGLWKTAPLLGVVFLIQALSLAGIPPLSGFWGKYMVIVEGLRMREWVLVALALIAGILTLFSMLKIWIGAFWRDASECGATVTLDDRRWKPMTAVIAGMTVFSLGVGLGAEGVLKISKEAARQIVDRAAYVDYMLGDRSPADAPPPPPPATPPVAPEPVAEETSNLIP
ncbi:proton-conducting transporter membrane subunit [Geminisphaera colitermitum]|uniref:proton-conducting transporter transmembrane domain-containing protein n=1 Tax=Geminisphaera colitermitum TaxID=1148786 RepID=UPI000158D616|nr:proton-conducting transporter membrane subunit [Geminisphaera colitermitum]